MGIVRLFELCSSKPICVYSVPNKVEKCFNNSYHTFLFYILVVLNSITTNVLRHRSVNLTKILTLHKKMKFSIKDFFSKFGQICRKLNSEFIIIGGINRPRAIFFPFSETGILLVIPKVRKIGTHLRL